MKSLADYDLPTLEQEFRAAGLLPSHAPRLLRHFYARNGAIEWQEAKAGRGVEAWIRDRVAVRRTRVRSRHQSADGTLKLLLDLDSGGTTETVLMPAHRPDRAAGCVSSQVGCAMGCDFCASTKSGLERDLLAGEIVEQYLHLKEEAGALGRRVASLVFMGMGEPMHNLDNVLAAIPRIAGPGMGSLGPRHITVSTVGVVPGIERLAAARTGVHLAVSLHAPDDPTRAAIVPTGRKWKVADILRAARHYQDTTRRIVTIEYCLLAGVNDSDAQAQLLADLTAGWRVHVNLIPYNVIGAGVSGRVYMRPSRSRMEAFAGILSARGVVTHFRATRGDDVSAACGQLRQRDAEAQPAPSAT